MRAVRWNFDALITKATKDEKGRMHVKAIASDNLEDRHGDRMSTKAIISMVKQANADQTPILPSHNDAFAIGKVNRAKTVHMKSKVQFALDAILDEDFPQSEKLFNSVKEGKREFQLSIGGFLNLDDDDAVEFEENKKGRIVRVINSLTLDHIAVTRKNMAANPRTGFRNAIVKTIEDSIKELGEEINNDDETLNGDEDEMSKKKEKKEDVDKNKKKEDDDDKVKKDKKEKKEDIDKNKKKEDDDTEDTETREEKLKSIVDDIINDLKEVHKSDDGEVTEDQIKTLKSVASAIDEFMKEINPEDESDDDDDDDDEEKDDIVSRLDSLQKSVDGNTVKLAKATAGAIDEIGKAVGNLAKQVKSITKNKQKGNRLSDYDDDDENVEKADCWKGIFGGKNGS